MLVFYIRSKSPLNGFMIYTKPSVIHQANSFNYYFLAKNNFHTQTVDMTENLECDLNWVQRLYC